MNKQIYQENENDSFTHNGRKYNLNALLRLTYSTKITSIDISEISWILKHTQYKNSEGAVVCNSCKEGPSSWHKERVSNADITKPILIINDKDNWVVLDGVHRLEHAVKKGLIELPAIVVTKEDLEKAAN